MSEHLVDQYPPGGPGEGRNEDEDEGRLTHLSHKARPEKAPIEGEIDLHGYRLEEAIMVTNQFVDESLELGRRKIRIIHGKGDNGQGVLRKEIRQFIEKHPRTGQLGYGKGSEGGRGALWVMLRYGP